MKNKNSVHAHEKTLNDNKKPLEDNTNKKKHGVWYYILNVLFWGIIAGAIIFSGCRMIDQKSGYTFLQHHSAVVVTDSMSVVNEANLSYLDPDCEHIYVGDVVRTDNYSSYDQVKKLDIIIYLDGSGTLICHRVVDKYVDGGINWVITRGDKNAIDDAPVNYNLIRGKVTKIDHGLGNVVNFFKSPYFLLALCFSIFFLLLGEFIYDYNKEKKENLEPAAEGPKPENVQPVKKVTNVTNVKTIKNIQVKKYKCAKCGSFVVFEEGAESTVCEKCGAHIRRKLKNEETTKDEESK